MSLLLLLLLTPPTLAKDSGAEPKAEKNEKADESAKADKSEKADKSSSKKASSAKPPKEKHLGISIEPVEELCLDGKVDATWAEGILAAEGLHARIVDGAAVATVCGQHSRFMGLAFSEATATLWVTNSAGGGSADAVYLADALNSRAFFAWVERSKNKLPYRNGQVETRAAGDSLRMRLVVGTTEVLDAAAPAIPPGSPTAMANYEGPAYLAGGKVFEVRLLGNETTVPFDASTHTFKLAAAGRDPMSDLLTAGRFTPTQWRVRPAGRHEKGRTKKREDRQA